MQPWAGDITSVYTAAALEGSNVVQIEMETIGPVLTLGHVIGHADNTYLITAIEYEGTIAVIEVTPPLRSNVAINDVAEFRPYFTGSIMNGSEIVTTYDAENNGHIQMPPIILSEVILP